MILLVICTTLGNSHKAHAQIPIIDIIKDASKKVIRAIDLQIQRLQNKMIWLQNAQKVIENNMAKLKLDQISDWTERQRKIYQEYFDELARVKSVITYYHRIKEMTEKQARMVEEYRSAWRRITGDRHFTADELEYMAQVYTGILDESLKNLDQLALVIQSLSTRMSDANRLEIVHTAAARIDENYNDLVQFNWQNARLSLQRARDQQDIETTKALYGIK